VDAGSTRPAAAKARWTFTDSPRHLKDRKVDGSTPSLPTTPELESSRVRARTFPDRPRAAALPDSALAYRFGYESLTP
jgi:hypothetical protein